MRWIACLKKAMKERMRNKMEANKAANFVIEKGKEPNNYVYRVPGEEQARSLAQQKIDDEKLIAEFEKGSKKKKDKTKTKNNKIK